MSKKIGLWLVKLGMDIYGVADFWDLVYTDVIEEVEE